MLKKAIKLSEIVYSINCDVKQDCKVCKSKYDNLKWCPKGYADDVKEAISILDSAMPKVKMIVRLKNKKKEFRYKWKNFKKL